MPIFIRLVSFTADGHKQIKSFRQGRSEFLSNLKKLNIKLVGEYVTTGKYDVVAILDAPDLNSVLKLSALTGASGRTRSETLSAIPAAEFEKLAESP
ncbi:MAG: GYD domain-containing protein [Nitrososphaerales archaeon]